jgi:HSP90 family molecular chaperone
LLSAIKESPFLEGLQNKDLRALLLIDPLNKCATAQFQGLEGKKLICVSQEGPKLKEANREKAHKANKATFSSSACGVSGD